jgi:hypothetical protein
MKELLQNKWLMLLLVLAIAYRIGVFAGVKKSGIWSNWFSYND